MDSDENDKAEVDEIWAAWTSPENIIGRMPGKEVNLVGGRHNDPGHRSLFSPRIRLRSRRRQSERI